MSELLYNADCVEIMKSLPANSIDAVITDPPYGLVSVVKRFGKSGSAEPKHGTDGRFNRLAKGFMGQEWDGSGIEYNPEMWAEVLRIMKPGAYLLSFGGTRTYHRMACAIEDAGFEVWDMLQWLYGSGFPKSHNLKGDKAGWGTALKPANEPICMARKPREGTFAENVETWGTGALNIDGSRIPSEEPIPINRLESWSGFGQVIRPEYTPEENINGRWPANVLLDEEAANLLDEQSGVLRSGSKDGIYYGWGAGREIYGDGKEYLQHSAASSGGASRFFYVAKASRKERDAGLDRRNIHPTVKPISLMGYLCKLITPPGGVVLDPFMGSGTTGIACVEQGFSFIGCEISPEYFGIAKTRIDEYKEHKL